MTLAILLFLLAATLNAVAVARGWKRVEYIAKPATMLILLALLVSHGDLRTFPVLAFFLGLTFSLAGDVFLMISYARFSNRWFIPGLVAFLLAHLAYIIALNTPLPDIAPLFSLGLALLLGITAARILRRILAAVHAKKLRRLALPVALYGIVITIMLLSALLTLYRLDWSTPAAGLVALGAGLFFLSDIILAWNKFVSPIRHGRVVNIIPYHLGQLALVVGILLQFAP